MSGPGSAAVLPVRPVINLNGQDNEELGHRLLSMLIVETTMGLYRCEVRLGNWGEKNGSIGYLYFDRATVDFGKPWKIKLGTGAGAQTLFEGRITGLEAQFPAAQRPYITVLAEDRFQDLRMTRRTRTFEQVTDVDLINRIASDHGLTPDVSVTGPQHRVLAQVNQSDLAFLRERARAVGAELWMEGSTLHAKPRSRRNSNPLVLNFPGSLREFSVLADLAQQRTSITVSGWDVSGKQGVSFAADAAVLGAELASGQTSGAGILSTALADRKDTVVHLAPRSVDEARAAAEAFFRDEARRFLTGRGLATPTAGLRVGATVDLRGLGPLFSGKYYVSAVQHLFDSVGGLRTEFVAERPGLGRAS